MLFRSLGGRAAEELTFGEISTGASSDLQSCNAVARDMITKYGMSERLGNLVFGSDSEVFLGKDYGHVQNYSEKLASIIDDEVKQIIDESYKKVQAILLEKIALLKAMADTLLEKEKIEGPEFEALYQAYTGPNGKALSEPAFPQPVVLAPERTDLPIIPDAGNSIPIKPVVPPTAGLADVASLPGESDKID